MYSKSQIKALELLDKYFSETPESIIKADIDAITQLSFVGSSAKDYFSLFHKHLNYEPFKKEAEMNHDIFFKKYAAETDNQARLLMMKNYMLNLSSAELDDFIFGNLKVIRNYIETTDLSEGESSFIFSELDKAKAMIQKPIKQAA
jgi:hypothetical protein